MLYWYDSKLVCNMWWPGVQSQPTLIYLVQIMTSCNYILWGQIDGHEHLTEYGWCLGLCLFPWSVKTGVLVDELIERGLPLSFSVPAASLSVRVPHQRMVSAVVTNGLITATSWANGWWGLNSVTSYLQKVDELCGNPSQLESPHSNTPFTLQQMFHARLVQHGSGDRWDCRWTSLDYAILAHPKEVVWSSRWWKWPTNDGCSRQWCCSLSALQDNATRVCCCWEEAEFKFSLVVTAHIHHVVHTGIKMAPAQ